jgi:hypothetical protein
MVVRFIALFAALIACASFARAQDDTERAAIRNVIERQLEAFQRDDGDAAFSLASPMIRQMFGTAEIFMDMVRQGYQPVYRPKAVEFGDIEEIAGQLAQKVHVIAPDGRPVTAVYVMTRLPDGAWRIDGCYLKAPERQQA